MERSTGGVLKAPGRPPDDPESRPAVPCNELVDLSLLASSSPIDDGFLFLLVVFLVAPGPEGFDDQSQFRALLATDMPP